MTSEKTVIRQLSVEHLKPKNIAVFSLKRSNPRRVDLNSKKSRLSTPNPGASLITSSSSSEDESILEDVVEPFTSAQCHNEELLRDNAISFHDESYQRSQCDDIEEDILQAHQTHKPERVLIKSLYNGAIQIHSKGFSMRLPLEERVESCLQETPRVASPQSFYDTSSAHQSPTCQSDSNNVVQEMMNDEGSGLQASMFKRNYSVFPISVIRSSLRFASKMRVSLCASLYLSSTLEYLASLVLKKAKTFLGNEQREIRELDVISALRSDPIASHLTQKALFPFPKHP